MRILVYGSRTFGGVVRNLVEDCGHEFVGFIDDIHQGPEILGTFETVSITHASHDYGCVNAVGYDNLAARQQITNRVIAAGYSLSCLIHPHAYIGRSSRVGAGCIVMAGALVDCNVELQTGVVIWPGAIVSHDSIVGANTFLSPNSTVCGCCHIGANCFIGAGAVVVDHTDMPDGMYIKAGDRYLTRRS